MHQQECALPMLYLAALVIVLCSGCKFWKKKTDVATTDLTFKTTLFKPSWCYRLQVFISGPIPTFDCEMGQFSRLLSLHNWLCFASKANSVDLDYNFNLFLTFLGSSIDGLHQNQLGTRILSANLQESIFCSHILEFGVAEFCSPIKSCSP